MVVSDITVKFKGYKCFVDEFAGFDKIMPINIIIGKNNSGKSSLIDLIEFFIKFNDLGQRMLVPGNVVFQFKDILPIQTLRQIFKNDNQKAELNPTYHGNDWNNHGEHLKGVGCLVEFDNSLHMKIIEWVNESLFYQKDPHKIAEKRKEVIISYFKQYREMPPNFFSNKILHKILAERNIIPEMSDKNRLKIYNDGEGASNIIQRFLNSTKLERDYIRKDLLNALNLIFKPDGSFNEIIVQHDEESDKWEIFLGEENKKPVPLSKSGSGLKTIIQVLLNLLIVPRIEEKKASDYIFAFEELENNLHPALLRRLFNYIEKFAKNNGCHFFITTHSPVVIDKFSTCDIAQIIHVTHDGKTARTKTIESFADKNNLLDDIGAKASDLMQANGIVWLEGPSDRIYFNKWIELISNGDIKEHRDYECAFFGGSILSHCNADGEDLNKDFINLLKINRNAVLIADSDKTSQKKPLKERLEKIKKEMDDIGAFVWVTEAKEIENYIPANILETLFEKSSLPEIEKYQHFYYLSETKKRKKNKLKDEGYWQIHHFPKTYDKVDLAHKVVASLNLSQMENRFDWNVKMTKVIDSIKKWNVER